MSGLNVRACSIMPVNLAGGGDELASAPVATGAIATLKVWLRFGIEHCNKAASARIMWHQAGNIVMVCERLMLLVFKLVLRRYYLKTADKPVFLFGLVGSIILRSHREGCGSLEHHGGQLTGW
jgi:hypothetical protein